MKGEEDEVGMMSHSDGDTDTDVTTPTKLKRSSMKRKRSISSRYSINTAFSDDSYGNDEESDGSLFQLPHTYR